MTENKPPLLQASELSEILETLYPLSDMDHSSVKELNSYDDRNYYFRASLEQASSEELQEYVLKLSNSYKRLEVLEGTNSVLRHTKSKNLNCPWPIPGRDGREVQFIDHSSLAANCTSKTSSEKWQVLVLAFVPGQVMDSLHHSEVNATLLHSVGNMVGRTATALADFHNCAIESREFLWDLKHLSELRVYLAAVDSAARKQMVTGVMQDFQKHVVPKMAGLRKGVVHGDMNGSNILLKQGWGRASETWEVSGIIDFGSVFHTCYVFELGVHVAYMMICVLKDGDRDDPLKLLQRVSPAVSGFLRAFPLNSEELDCLYYSVLGRLCQSGVLGLHTYKQTGDEHVLNTHCLKAWEVMEIMLKTSKEHVDKIWFT